MRSDSAAALLSHPAADASWPLARYCAGDVSGERGGHPCRNGRLEPWRLGRGPEGGGPRRCARQLVECRGMARSPPGPDQVKRMWEKFVEPWESVRFEVDEFID